MRGVRYIAAAALAIAAGAATRAQQPPDRKPDVLAARRLCGRRSRAGHDQRAAGSRRSLRPRSRGAPAVLHVLPARPSAANACAPSTARGSRSCRLLASMRCRSKARLTTCCCATGSNTSARCLDAKNAFAVRRTRWCRSSTTSRGCRRTGSGSRSSPPRRHWRRCAASTPGWLPRAPGSTRG